MDLDEEGQRNYYSPLSTMVEDRTEKSKQDYDISNQSQLSINKEFQFEKEDYSSNSNFVEQTQYNIKTQPFQEHERKEQTNFHPLDIKKTEVKKEEQVVLTKSRQKLYLGGRMKIVIASFVVIMIALIFSIAWNFSTISVPMSQLSEKEITIAELQNSITSLTEEYNLLDSDDYLKELAEEAGFVEVTDDNTKIIELSEMYEEPSVTEIPSNWFNDVCNFLQKIFN